jgi:hypothetical protein
METAAQARRRHRLRRKKVDHDERAPYMQAVSGSRVNDLIYSCGYLLSYSMLRDQLQAP